jgi:hypothetical protein
VHVFGGMHGFGVVEFGEEIKPSGKTMFGKLGYFRSAVWRYVNKGKEEGDEVAIAFFCEVRALAQRGKYLGMVGLGIKTVP